MEFIPAFEKMMEVRVLFTMYLEEHGYALSEILADTSLGPMTLIEM